MSFVDQPITGTGAADDSSRLPDDMSPGLDPNQEYMFRAMSNMLNSMGLGSLFSFVGGKPAGWLWEQIVTKDWSSEDELMIALEERPEFRERFKVMFDQRDQAARGEPVQIMTPAEIRAYEQQAQQIMRQAGLPSEFYDSYKDFQNLMDKRISVNQLNQRVSQSLNRVYDAPQEIRQVFGEYYGAQGDAVLAAFFLDPDKVEADLDRYSRAAVVGGIARQQGFEADRLVAEDLARMGASENDRSRIAQVGATKPLFEETISETEDLQAGDQGLKAAFDASGEAAAQVRARSKNREAAFTAGGGASRDRKGYGLGTVQ